MDSKPLAETLCRIARQDTNSDNIGRLIISECQNELNYPTLNAQEILKVFHEYYPKAELDHRTQNVILVFWDGKEDIKNSRSMRTPVNIKPPPIFDSKDELFSNKNEYADPEEIPATKIGPDKILLMEEEADEPIDTETVSEESGNEDE